MTAESVRVEHLLRELAPQVLGVLTRRHATLDLADDAMQEALLAASEQWTRDGLPSNPRGWLYHVARRRLMDFARSDVARRRREEALIVAAHEASVLTDADPFASEEDDSLVLLFMCAHPALSMPTAIALTLRAVGGLTTAEIARAFFVPEATMAQRISRAKATIKASQVPFALPDAAQHEGRLRAVRHVLYLIFSEGYASSSGATLQRTDLTREAIRLSRMLYAQLPDESEVMGLLALMLLTEARRDARASQTGALIPLDEQDRSRWNAELIAEGAALVTRAFTRGRVGPYQLQAAIAALHDQATHVGDTDWPQILALYEVLRRLQDNPMVALSHAIATAMVHGPPAGLSLLDTLEANTAAASPLSTQYRVDAARAHLYERLGDVERAGALYLSAAGRTASIPERDYLLEKAARMASRQSAASSSA